MAIDDASITDGSPAEGGAAATGLASKGGASVAAGLPAEREAAAAGFGVDGARDGAGVATAVCFCIRSVGRGDSAGGAGDPPSYVFRDISGVPEGAVETAAGGAAPDAEVDSVGPATGLVAVCFGSAAGLPGIDRGCVSSNTSGRSVRAVVRDSSSLIDSFELRWTGSIPAAVSVFETGTPRDTVSGPEAMSLFAALAMFRASPGGTTGYGPKRSVSARETTILPTGGAGRRPIRANGD